MQLVSSLHRVNALPALAKVGIVTGGYFAAILFATFVVWLSIVYSGVPEAEREASAGMYGFGEALLFLAAFGALSIVPTACALVFLRQKRGFWVACSALALIVGGTSLVTVALDVLAPKVALGTVLNMWAMLAFPWIFLSPFLAATFGLSALVAPDSLFRRCLFGAAAMEASSSVYGFLRWFAPLIFG